MAVNFDPYKAYRKDIISGRTGPYNSNTAESYAKNASYNYGVYNSKILNGYVNPNYVIDAGEMPTDTLDLSCYRSTSYAYEDLKRHGGQIPVRNNPSLSPVDTDGDGVISLPENTAVVLFQKMLSKNPVGNENSQVFTTEDINTKINEKGVAQSLGLIFGKSADNTKNLLAGIRKELNLDKLAQYFLTS
ncbi:MAG: hypothetical protein V2B14_03290 [bacterium]